MRKIEHRSMTSKELRHFLETYQDHARPIAIPVGGVPGERVEIHFTVGELREEALGQGDDEQLGLGSTTGIWAVIGFICTNPPTLVVSRSSESTQSN